MVFSLISCESTNVEREGETHTHTGVEERDRDRDTKENKDEAYYDIQSPAEDIQKSTSVLIL